MKMNESVVLIEKGQKRNLVALIVLEPLPAFSEPEG